MTKLSTANLLSIHVLILRIFVFGGATRIVGAGSRQSQIGLSKGVLSANPLPGASGLGKLTTKIMNNFSDICWLWRLLEAKLVISGQLLGYACKLEEFRNILQRVDEVMGSTISLQSVQVNLICSARLQAPRLEIISTTRSATWRFDNIQKKDTQLREHSMFATGPSWPHMATIPSPSSELCVQCSSVYSIEVPRILHKTGDRQVKPGPGWPHLAHNTHNGHPFLGINI